jgi:hypothetical protein
MVEQKTDLASTRDRRCLHSFTTVHTTIVRLVKLSEKSLPTKCKRTKEQTTQTDSDLFQKRKEKAIIVDCFQVSNKKQKKKRIEMQKLLDSGVPMASLDHFPHTFDDF